MIKYKRFDEIKNLLQSNIGGENWKITKPDRGLSKETYIVKNDKKTYFLKFDINIPPLLRVSELGLTPKIVNYGKLHNENFVVQEYIEGVHPDRKWFSKNINILADFIKSYHGDKKLAELLPFNRNFNSQKHLNDDISNLRESIKKANNEIYKSTIFIKEFNDFVRQGKKLEIVKPVPIHADPNFNNFLLVNGKLYFVDWDNVMLSDPLRDIGLILWWYLPKTKWNDFFTRYGIKNNKNTLDRLFWWVSARSLAVSLWFLLQKDDLKEAKKYLKDFYTALNRKYNKFK